MLGIEQDISNFSIRSDNGKYRNVCESCRKKRRSLYYLNNKETELQYYKDNSVSISEKRQKYYQNNKDLFSQRDKLYYQNNKEEINNRNNIYYEVHSKELCDKAKEYRKTNQDKIFILNNKYYLENKSNIIKQHINYIRLKYKTDPVFKIRRLISNDINQMLKMSSSSKNGKSCLKYLSYSIQELKTHLETQFESWMTWDNHGIYNKTIWNDNDSTTWTWQIDHIIPQYKLPYSSMEEENFKICWSLSNLRPYSSKQNVIDGTNKVR